MKVGKKAASARVQVALLRGLNVGGKNRLAMVDLAAIFAEAGALDVETYIQSGNLVFRASPALAARLPGAVSAAIAGRHRLEVPVLLRSAPELRRVARGNPFLRPGVDPSTLHVAFLADRPGPARVAGLDPGRSPPDEFAVRGREIYLRCPGGLGRSRLTNQYFDSRLGTTSTVRNWRTVLELLEIAGRL